jgi:long-chain acyl-CoA synthetase
VEGAEASADELRHHCAEELAAYKVPKRFEFVAELPRTEAGELARAALR